MMQSGQVLPSKVPAVGFFHEVRAGSKRSSPDISCCIVVQILVTLSFDFLLHSLTSTQFKNQNFSPNVCIVLHFNIVRQTAISSFSWEWLYVSVSLNI